MKEQINHPSHYNNHPSDVEAIDVIRSFSFNLGSSFKYVYRRNDKENCLQDLKKAKWYLLDEIKSRRDRKVGIFSSFFKVLQWPNPFNYIQWRDRSELIQRILDTEEDENCKIIYKYLNDCDYFIYEIGDLYKITNALDNLIKEEEYKNSF